MNYISYDSGNKSRYETPDYIRLSQNIHAGYAQAHNAKLVPEGFFELLSLAEYGKKSIP
jgi:hypothetical protein